MKFVLFAFYFLTLMLFIFSFLSCSNVSPTPVHLVSSRLLTLYYNKIHKSVTVFFIYNKCYPKHKYSQSQYATLASNQAYSISTIVSSKKDQQQNV